MTTRMSGNHVLCVCRPGGRDCPGREIKSGLYRMAAGNGGWELLTQGLPAAPAIRAITVHPATAGSGVCGDPGGAIRPPTTVNTGKR